MEHTQGPIPFAVAGNMDHFVYYSSLAGSTVQNDWVEERIDSIDIQLGHMVKRYDSS
jgi:hypothetical protein